MNNRRRPALRCSLGCAGRRLPGGCEDCDAYQTLARHPDDARGGVYVLTVHHDETCPWLSDHLTTERNHR